MCRYGVNSKHGGRLFADVESQPSWCVPFGDRLDKVTRREDAFADRSDSATRDPRTLRAGNAQPKEPLRLTGNVREGDHLIPNNVRAGRRRGFSATTAFSKNQRTNRSPSPGTIA